MGMSEALYVAVKYPICVKVIIDEGLTSKRNVPSSRLLEPITPEKILTLPIGLSFSLRTMPCTLMIWVKDRENNKNVSIVLCLILNFLYLVFL